MSVMRRGWRLAVGALAAASIAGASTDKVAVSVGFNSEDVVPVIAFNSSLLAWLEDPLPAINRWLDHPVPVAVVAASQGILRSSRAVFTVFVVGVYVPIIHGRSGTYLRRIVSVQFALNTLDYKISLNLGDKTTEEYYASRSEVSFLVVDEFEMCALQC